MKKQGKYVRPKFARLAGLPELSFPQPHGSCEPLVHDDDCYALWDKYAMPENIRRHSRLVAHIAQNLAELAVQKNVQISISAVRASGLLHDLGKLYTLQYGGSHALLGASWVVSELRNHTIAQGVLHHVYWPWPVSPDASICQLPLLVLYADKRARHDECVSIEDRYQDLIVRYGVNQEARASIKASFEQVRAIEEALSTFLGWECLDAYSFTSRGMVD